MTTSTSTRRNLRELRTLYTLKPHFRDVVVEGRDDAAWIKWYLTEHQVEHVRVYAVDDRVTVPGELVLESHREVNARGRVVALSTEFDKWHTDQPSLTCVVDSDFELFEPAVSSGGLLKTDFAAMEVYSLYNRPLSKFLVTSAKSDLSAQHVVSMLKPAWSALYALRYVLHRHADGAKLTDKFANKCFNRAGEVMVDVRKLLLATDPSPTRDVLDQLLVMHKGYLERIPKDSLQGIRGHDIAPLIIKFLNLKNDMAKPDELERVLRQSVELRDLDELDLFKSLKSRLRQ